MSDEYSSSGSGFQGSLVNPSINDVLPPREGETYPPSSDYATKNYPPPGDTTSSGGRRTGPVASQFESGNIGPDVRGQQLQQQREEAPLALGVAQGRDPSAESLDTRKEAAEALAARYRASRERLHEGHGAGVDSVGA